MESWVLGSGLATLSYAAHACVGHEVHMPVPCWQGREKIALIELFTVMGFDILITDVDAIWCATCPAVCIWAGRLLPLAAAVIVNLFLLHRPTYMQS